MPQTPEGLRDPLCGTTWQSRAVSISETSCSLSQAEGDDWAARANHLFFKAKKQRKYKAKTTSLLFFSRFISFFSDNNSRSCTKVFSQHSKKLVKTSMGSKKSVSFCHHLCTIMCMLKEYLSRSHILKMFAGNRVSVSLQKKVHNSSSFFRRAFVLEMTLQWLFLAFLYYL